MAKSPTSAIRGALGTASNFPASLGSVANRVRRALLDDGWKVVRATKTERLTELLDTIYVDNRRKVQVDALAEARKIAQSL